MDELEIMRALEALLFTAEKPVTIHQLRSVFDGESSREIESALARLQKHYRDHAIELTKVGGGYLLVTKPEYHSYIKKLFSSRSRPRLSRAALETLSVIAYKQPVSRVEIEMIRGVNSDGVLGTLLERNLITIKGRAETVGRPLLYGTTEEFLQYFGLNDLSELPRPDEIEAMLKKREEEKTETESEEGERVRNQDSD